MSKAINAIVTLFRAANPGLTADMTAVNSDTKRK